VRPADLEWMTGDSEVTYLMFVKNANLKTSLANRDYHQLSVTCDKAIYQQLRRPW